jgi:hypothetical protein
MKKMEKIRGESEEAGYPVFPPSFPIFFFFFIFVSFLRGR